MTAQTTIDPGAEFDRQVDNLLEHGYPDLAGLAPDQFRGLVAPLREAATDLPAPLYDPAGGRVPLLLVVTRHIAPIEQTMPRASLPGKHKPGFVDHSFEPGALERFVAIEQIQLPDQHAYLVLDVERGEEFCSVVPNDAMEVIAGRGRSLLTIEEGIALLTHFPQLLVRNKCFSLGGSRAADRRVPAIWISKNAPKLGWCWEGNPHTWLGMASASSRR